MKRSLKNILWMLIGASVLNFLSGHLLGEIAFETGRVIIALAGGYFLFAHFFFPTAVDGKELISAAGVLMSYVFVLPIAAGCSWLGGFLARRKSASADVAALPLNIKS